VFIKTPLTVFQEQHAPLSLFMLIICNDVNLVFTAKMNQIWRNNEFTQWSNNN